MADRTVSVRLEADISPLVGSLAKAAAATKGLGSDMERTVRRDIEPAMKRAGERSGGVLAQGINSSLIRNSPLIAAAVGGALAAGAPVAIAGAAMLFGGIGAIAAAQSSDVRKSWMALGDEIASGTVEDARVLIPELTALADDLGESFEDLRPQLRDAFEAAAPLVETFGDAVSGLVRNAMPGFVQAVQSADPVMAGFQSFLESTGTGLSDFFGGLATHAPAAGVAFDALGDIVGELLPLIGELLGNGVELASVVLPPVATALGAVTDVAQMLGPLLPAIVAGFAGMRIVNGVAAGLTGMSGGLSRIAQSAAMATYHVDGFAGRAATGASEAASRTGRAFSTMGENVGKASAALPVLGIVLAGVSADLSDATTEEERWAQAILAGGTAATQAYAEYQEGTHWGQAIDEATGLSSSWNEARAKANELRDAMSPLEQAQLRAEQAQRALRLAVDEFGANSPQAVAAVDQYEAAQYELQQQSSATELAIHGVTQAMIDQYNQAMAATNAAFGYRDAQNSVEDASTALAEAQAHLSDENVETRTTTEDVERAGLALEQALYAQATAAGQLASDALPATASELEHNEAAAQGALAELYRMRDEMGGAFPASLQTTIRNLESTGVKVDTTSGQFRYLGDQVNAVPEFKNIRVDADLGPAAAKLNDFLSKNYEKIINSRVVGSGTSGSGGTNRRLATGGYVAGPGTGTSDSIPAMLSNGEFVINARATAYNRGLLEAINRGGLAHFATGGYVGDNITVKYDMDLSRAEQDLAGLVQAATVAGGSLGGGTLGSGWQSIFNAIKAIIPQARVNSAYRPGDPGAHGRGKAVDFGFGSGPGGAGSAGLALINRTLHDRFGSSLYELIYDGIGDDRPDLKNGRPLTYNAQTRAQHRNHVHAAVYHDGTDFVPQTGWAYLERGEAVVPKEMNPQSREFTGSTAVFSGAAGGASNVTVEARVFVGNREITDIVRVEANAVVAQHDAQVARQMRSAQR